MIKCLFIQILTIEVNCINPVDSYKSVIYTAANNIIECYLYFQYILRLGSWKDYSQLLDFLP